MSPQEQIQRGRARALYMHQGIPVPKDAPCYVVFGAAKEYTASGRFGLSIKTARRGSVLFECGGGAHLVTPDSYLVINDGQEYSVSIRSAQPSQPVSFFYTKQMVDEVVEAWTADHQDVLSERGLRSPREQEFYEKLYFEPGMLKLLRRFFLTFDDLRDDHNWLLEQSTALLRQLLTVHVDTMAEVEALRLARESTREEVYRRLHKVRDYALAHLNESVSLEELANIACFSPSYFMRTFKAVFGTTPYQFIVRHRLERAKRLLIHTDMPIGEICHAVGFQSFGAFSWFFSKKTGASPERFRKAQRERTALLAG